MKNWLTLLILHSALITGFSQDWEGIMVPPSPGSGMVWELQEDVSDDFNYEAPPVAAVDTFDGKWVNWYHNTWTGPLPTVWRRDHIFVEDGNMKVIASRPEGDSVTVDYNGTDYTLAVTNLGCATSTGQVQYPVYVEANVKIMRSVLASAVWLLSPDDTQEIDICEAYGGDRWNNPFFSDTRLHLSHHVFIREPFTDWQPNDAGSFYTDGSTVWHEDYHRIGVYWIDPWNLEYYVDGQLVRTRSGPDEIDPVYHTNAVNPGDPTNDTRTGLSKPMDIIIDTEDQTWRAVQGLTPTDEELANEEDNTFQVDWIRVYKPVPGEVGPVTSISVDPETANSFIDGTVTLQESIEPYNANDLSVTWSTDNPDVATVDEEGVVSCHAEGTAVITVTSNENPAISATSTITVSGVYQAPFVSLIDASEYLNTNYEVGGELEVSCNFHAGSGNTVIAGGSGGVKFWLREITPGWGVANDYVVSDASAIGQESGVATGSISLEGVPPTADIPAENWYFLYVTFENSNGEVLDTGTYPINIVGPTSVEGEPYVQRLPLYPNPANSVLYVPLSGAPDEFVLQLVDASGKVIPLSGYRSDNSRLELSIDTLAKGFYVLRLVVGTDVYVAPFVKQ